MSNCFNKCLLIVIFWLATLTVSYAFNGVMQFASKPGKEAVKQAKILKKEGWQSYDTDQSIELQIEACLCRAKEQMVDSVGIKEDRYVIASATQAASNYQLGYNAARSKALSEIASLLESRVSSLIKYKMRNSQMSGDNMESTIHLQTLMKSAVSTTINHSETILALYRRLSNGNVEIMVQIAYDCQELLSQTVFCSTPRQ